MLLFDTTVHGSRGRRAVALATLVAIAAVLVVTANTRRANAYGHSAYSYRGGKNCAGDSNILDPVSVQFLTKRTVQQVSDAVAKDSADRRKENGSVKYWQAGNIFDDGTNKNQQSAYFKNGTRICSSYTAGNATSGAAKTRYHMRFHTGGSSSSWAGYNIVGATPHYDKLCGLPLHPRHDIATFAGARTQFAKIYPKSRYKQYIKYVGNTHSRHQKCLNIDIASDGYVLFLFADARR